MLYTLHRTISNYNSSISNYKNIFFLRRVQKCVVLSVFSCFQIKNITKKFKKRKTIDVFTKCKIRIKCVVRWKAFDATISCFEIYVTFCFRLDKIEKCDTAEGYRCLNFFLNWYFSIPFTTTLIHSHEQNESNVKEAINMSIIFGVSILLAQRELCLYSLRILSIIVIRKSILSINLCIYAI